jgi:hypothetical protein
MIWSTLVYVTEMFHMAHCFDSTSYDKSFDEENIPFKVLSISRPCDVGKIINNLSNPKNVAKTTIMNIAIIIKIKIPIVFMSLTFNFVVVVMVIPLNVVDRTLG